MASPLEDMRVDEEIPFSSNKKRKIEEIREENENGPIHMLDDSELDGSNFQKLLTRKDTDLPSVLKRCLPHFKETPPEDAEGQHDLVVEYLEASPHCEELLDVLSDTNRPDSTINVTLNILTAILLRLAQDPVQQRAAALRVVRRLIRSHFEALMKFLNVSKYGPKTVLRMFAVIVTLGHRCALELLGTFNIGAPHLQKLGLIRKGKEDEDPRAHFVKFAMSLFICDSNEVIERAIKCKEFCHTLFHKLIQDRASLIQLILATLKDRVVENTSIARKTKRLLFSAATLGQIAELYTWGEMFKGAKDPGIVDLAHHFLQLVCCSPKYGICYRDDSYGLDKRVANNTLLTFVSHLKTSSALKHPLMGDLVVSIFKTCPDLLTPYLKERGTKFTPRPYPDWLNNIMLFEKIYTAYPDVSYVLQAKHRTMSLERMLNIVMVTALPPIFTREQYLKNFKGLSLPVHFGLLKICKLQLQRTVRIIRFCEAQSRKERTLLSSAEWTEFIGRLKGACKNVLPDAEFFVGFYAKQQTNLRSGNKKQAKEEDTEQWMQSQASSPDLDIKPEVVLLGVLDILRLQQTLFPDCLEGLSLDLNGIFSESLSVSFIEKLSDEGDASIRIVRSLMVFLRGVPPKKILWFKAKKGSSLFSQALTLLLSSKLVQSEAQLLLCKILMGTGHFEREEEAMAWLVTLHDLDQSHRVAVIDFLKKSLVKVVRDPHPFNDRILEAMATAQLRREGEGDSHLETASLAEAGIAAILDQEAYAIEPAGPDDVSMATSQVDHSGYCSALLPAALEEFFILKGKGQADGVESYLSSVITLVINQQRDPAPLSILVDACYQRAKAAHKMDPLSGAFGECLKYCHFWLEKGGREDQEMADEGAITRLLGNLEDKSFIEVLQSTYLIGPRVFSESILLGRLNGLARTLPAYLVLPACRQITFYLQNIDGDRQVFDGVLINLLHIVWDRASQLQEESTRTVALGDDEQPEMSEVIPWASIGHTLFSNGTYPDWQNYGSHLSFPRNVANTFDEGTCLQKHFLVLLEKFVSMQTSTVEHSRDLPDSIFSKIVTGCLQRLAELEESSSESKWKKYYKRCDWLEHVGLAGPGVFHELCCKVLSLLPSFPDSKSLLRLFLALPCDLKELPMSAIDDLVSVVNQRGDATLDEVFCSFVEGSPAVALKVPVGLLERCLSAEENKTYGRLAQTLIVHSPVLRVHFARFCSSPDGQETVRRKLVEEPATFQPVICKYLVVVSRTSDRRKEDEVALPLLLDIAWTHLVGAHLGSDTKQPKWMRSLLDAVCKLIPTSQLQQQAEACAGNIVKGVGGRKLNFLQATFGELATREDGLNVHETSLAVLKDVLESCNKSSGGPRGKHYRALITILEKSPPMTPDQRLAKLWRKFTSGCMREDFQSPCFQELMKRLAFLLYDGNHGNIEGLISPGSLFTKIVSHPMFVSTMMENDRTKSPDVVEAKAHLTELMLFITRKDSSSQSADHVATWLGAYQASSSATDRRLLKILEVYESNGVDMKAFRPFLWGQAAMDHYSATRALSPSVLTQPTMREVLDLVDPYRMLQTALRMPLDQPLTTEVISTDQDESSLYDPSFMMALFSSLLEPECLVDCLRFVECNGLSLTVACLSSYYEDTRRVASYILAQLEQHLEGARFRGRREISHLLTCLKNTVPEPGARLPSITTAFVGRACKQMLNPSGPVFEHILQYVSIEPKLPLNLVPAFNSLFLAKGQEHEVKRAWILNLLEDGLRDHSDFVIYVRNNIWSLLMTLTGSPHCSKEDQMKIMAIITKASTIPHAALSLVSNHSLFTWTLSNHTGGEESVARTLGVLEGVIGSIGGLCKKDNSSEMTGVFEKALQALYVNCISMLRGLITPSPTILLRIISLLQKTCQNMNGISKEVEDSPQGCRQPQLTATSLRDILSVYAETLNDPGLPILTENSVTVGQQKASNPNTEVQQAWIAEDLNRRTADSLHYLVYYWLKHCTNSGSANQDPHTTACDTGMAQGGVKKEEGCQPSDLALPVVTILWALNHFVRTRGDVGSPEMSEFLAAISMVCAKDQSTAKELADHLQGKDVSESVLSVYHLLNDAPSNSCLDNREREAITRSLNKLLLDLSGSMKVKKAFKSYRKEWARATSREDASLDHERLSVLMQEMWGGASRPTSYDNLPPT